MNKATTSVKRDWPSVIDAELISMNFTRPGQALCSFRESGLQIRGHAIGLIKSQRRTNGTNELISGTLNKGDLELTTTIPRICGNLNETCSDYAALHIDHEKAFLNAFRQWTLDTPDEFQRGKLRKADRKVDQLCLAAVPMNTQHGDLFCSLTGISAFLVLRPLQLQENICRIRFVGIAVAAEDIFDKSVLLTNHAQDSNMSLENGHEQERASIEFIDCVIKEALNRNEARYSQTAGSKWDVKKQEYQASRPRLRYSVPHETLWSAEWDFSFREHTLPKRGTGPFLQHFNSPIHSLRLTFDIV